MIKYINILSDIIQGKQNWTDLKSVLSMYNIDNREAGIKDTSAGQIFEVFAKYYFLTAPEIDGLYSDVWLYDEIPLNIKAKLDLGTVEYGIDLLLKTIDDKYIAVQCKFKNDETSKLNWSSDKISNLFAYCPKADGFIVFSNCSALDKVSLSRQENFTFYSIGHLLEIEASVFTNISLLLNNRQPKEKTFFKPKLHQQSAIDECVQWFTEGEESRGQLILPCGAGKTFTALWIKEELKSLKTLVLVPSLALLRQIKNEWSKQRKTKYQYLCVCSERDIDKDNTDSIVTHTYEIGGNVTTEPNEILSFLNQDLNEKVIFSTYQSLPRIIESIQNTEISFDFVFCDEAHKTAGISKGVFGLVHDNVKVPAKRRLYATATPRIVKESLKKKLGDDLKYTHDMNDPEKFGEELYRMSFKDAIDEDILVDYKIVAIGVNDLQLATYIQDRKFVDNNISIDEVANNYALDFVMNKYSANHGLTFHSRVKLAKEFASRHSKLFKKTTSFSVDGTQSTSIRNQILNEFKTSTKAIISNARCLTEGVDVPTIDLVYFSDPKNSKVDIIQAVGRALRKKEGKKLGYIVIPIYHTNNDEVENSIRQGSFKNLLQVIRSLCDQDERLQDEINSIAFGKGKRGSKKIDIISSFDEEIDSLHLIGFEEKLRESLFDQIIYKTSNNWDIWFLEFKSYIEINNDYPNKSDNKDLYAWISQQRNRRKNGSLKIEEIRKLNSIDFAWNIVDFKWNKLFDSFQEYAETNVFPPCKDIDSTDLVKWYKYQQTCIKEDKIISKEQKHKFLEIDNKFQGPASRKKWIPLYKELVNYRKSNPTKWPTRSRINPTEEEIKLNSFCQSIRSRFRKDELGNYWFDKMSSIGFNFEGHLDNWSAKFEEYYALVESEKSISVNHIGQTAYAWISLQIKKDDNGQLSKKQSEDFSKIRSYFKTWEQQFESIKKWTIENGKLPTRITQKDFHSWLGSQRAVYKNGNLTEIQVKKLSSIGYEMEAKGNEKKRDRWLEMYDNLVIYRKDNPNRWPKYNRNDSKSRESKLYSWCLANRQAFLGSKGDRYKPLKQFRVDKLNEIGFIWNSKEDEKTWEESFTEFLENLKENRMIKIPSMIKGKRNPLYAWWAKQKYDFKNNELQIERINAFKDIGIDLSNLKSSGRNGFTKWANKIKEIASFKENQGYYPKARKDKEQGNLYQSLARTKRACQNNELSSEQIELLNELNIEL
jgi:superfamily II DNA or RNA helicase